MEVLTIGWGYERRWIGWFAISIANISTRGGYLQYTNGAWRIRNQWLWTLISLSILWGRRERLKQCHSSQDSISLWSLPWCSLNLLNGWSRENIFGVDCWNGCTQKQVGEKLLWYWGRSVTASRRDDLVKK